MVKGTGKMEMPGGDRPGKELPKDYRDVAIELVDNQGWRYDAGSGRGHPLLYPADVNKQPVTARRATVGVS
jgi:hypothetical protein